MFRCEKEVFTRGKLDALESAQRLFPNRKTRTFTGSLSKENIALEKWKRLSLAGEATDDFPFWYSVSFFFQRYMCFSSVRCSCRWLIFSPVVYKLQCRQRAYPARSDVMVGTVPSICTVVAAGKFCGLLWADWLFCFLLTIVSLFGCLLLSTVKSLFSAVLNLAQSSFYRRSSKRGWN